MKHPTILISILAIAACGGNKPPPAEPKEPDPAPAAPAPAPEAKPAPEPEPAPAPEPPAPPPAPKTLYAQASLLPVKGAKIKGTTVTFTQEGDQPVAVASNGWFDGLKPGKYHLVVHEAADCGPNATKAGKPMATADVPFTAAKGMDALSIAQAATIQLQGDAAVIGHALVLHADAKGKPGKALACGAIAAAGE
jgi:Cu/Zn superoxide dismutase